MRTTLGQCLAGRLARTGIDHAFGVPGDYVLDFMDCLLESPVRLINTATELNAGYAADGYARVRGIGVLAITYGVGGLSALNAVAGAYAERVPLVVVSGAPHSRMQTGGKLMHHLVGRYALQREIFEKVTCRAFVLDDPRQAPRLIDEALSACLREKRPVYLEIPADQVGQPCEAPEEPARFPDAVSDASALTEAVHESVELIQRAETTAVLAGMEIRRFGLQNSLLAFLEKSGFYATVTIGGKSAIPEIHPRYGGVYQGGFTSGSAHDLVEQASCLLGLGAWMTDIATGGFTAHLDPSRMISAHGDKVRIRHHVYDNVLLGDFISALTSALPAAPAAKARSPRLCPPSGDERPGTGAVLSVSRFFTLTGAFLQPGMKVVCDTGDVMFGATELLRPEAESFLSQDFYLSIGYALPAALGAGLAAPGNRPVVFIGDGAFQMTAPELGTFRRAGVKPVVFVLNNDGYVIERLIHDGPYNEIARWRYSQLPEAMSAGIGSTASTEEELTESLALAAREENQLVLIEAIVDRRDSTETLRHVADNIRNLSRRSPLR